MFYIEWLLSFVFCFPFASLFFFLFYFANFANNYNSNNSNSLVFSVFSFCARLKKKMCRFSFDLLNFDLLSLELCCFCIWNCYFRIRICVWALASELSRWWNYEVVIADSNNIIVFEAHRHCYYLYHCHCVLKSNLKSNLKSVI